jgi:invasion protein IalB
VSATFNGNKVFTCNQCGGDVEMDLHVYAETNEILVFGHTCYQCQTPVEAVAEIVSGIEKLGPTTVHMSQQGQAWCLHCDTPTSVKCNMMHTHVRDVHPQIWAALP